MVIRRNGWIYVYLSNESNQDVFFDNLVVNLVHGPLIEQKDYYSFGTEIAGLSTQAIKYNYNGNKYNYNGKEKQSKEFNDGTGLEEIDYGARLYDPLIGMWHNSDPYADQTPSLSPYTYVADNPITLTDPDGRIISGDTTLVNELIKTAGNIKKREQANQKRLEAKIAKRQSKGKSTRNQENNLAESKERVNELDGLTSNIQSLKNSDQDYHVIGNWTPTGSSSGETTYNPATKAIDVKISASYGLSGLAHELTHASQFENGQIDYLTNGAAAGFLYDLTDEISSYRAQFAINGSLGSVNDFDGITASFVRGLLASYSTLPAASLDKNTPNQIIFFMHRTSNSQVTYYPILPDRLKTYQDSKNTIFLQSTSR